MLGWVGVETTKIQEEPPISYHTDTELNDFTQPKMGGDAEPPRSN